MTTIKTNQIILSSGNSLEDKEANELGHFEEFSLYDETITYVTSSDTSQFLD